MKVRAVQASEEKTILMALITHSGILGRIFRELNSQQGEGLFRNRWANLVTGWCFEFYGKHKEAPGRAIQDFYARHVATRQDDEESGLVESFLQTLSDEYEKIPEQLNEQWVMDRAGDYFEKVRLERLTNQMQNSLENNDLGRARQLYAAHKPVSFSSDAWLNPFSQESIHKTMERMEKVKPVIEFRGDLGRFLSEHFERDAFISFAGPEKRGKSFWLQEVVWTALNQRRRVLYYVFGDMSEEQVKRRLYSRMTLKPRKELKHAIKWPKGIKLGPKDDEGRPTALVDAEDTWPTPYHIAEVQRAVEELRLNSAMKLSPLRVKCAPAGTVSASDIESDVDQMSATGWVPDVVVIDYADLTKVEESVARQEFRHQINATWEVMRRISLDYHNLVVTATQAAARSYDRWLMRKGDFSEDKRKNAHVTGMIGINQTPKEKLIGIYRLNWVFLRDGEWTEDQYVWTAGNLALGCPCARSLLR
jgi:hypothetical protein